MTNTPNIPNNDDGPPPRDELDAMLREWHSANAEKAAAGRDRLMAALTHEDAAANDPVLHRIEPKPETAAARRPLTTIRRIVMNKYSPLAAAAVLLAALLPFLLPGKFGVGTTNADTTIVMAPDGGRLDAFDKAGNLLGPCTLKHTDVKAEISGRFSRVTVVQQYHNSNPDKIEAVYTFPLSDRSGVDRMTMTIGDRVIVGEVKERQQARRIYEQAKANDRVASLLEQERPNIFTQSIANIEPGATINIEISYVEMVAEHDGEFSFAFPTVVSPRYIPGQPDYQREKPQLPAGIHARRGLVLEGPASIAVIDNGPGISRSDRGLDDRLLNSAVISAIPVTAPENAQTEIAYFVIQASYGDGSREKGLYRRDGFGQIGGRWFYCPPAQPPQAPGDHAAPGDSFAQPTNQVPDADRITPMPTRPGTRAGHDISISVLMDTGGPGIISLESPQHKVNRTDLARNGAEQPRRISLALANLAEIPNRDFVLKWKQTADAISSRMFTHTGETGNFFCVQLDPPAQVKDIRAVPRELVFVVDTSGSMNGRPIELSKEVMRKAIDQMRPQDTFNIITFAGATNIMWDRPRPNTTANRDEAQKFIESWQGSGGTEMMTAIEAALRQGPVTGMGNVLTPAQLADLPADGRQVAVEADDGVFRSEGLSKDAETDRAELFLRDDLSIKCTPFKLPEAYLKRATQTLGNEEITLKLLMRGIWITKNGERIFEVSSAEMSSDSSVRPLRIVMFLTDAEVGNDMAIIDAVKRNRSTTRVFSFGIGSSVNRYLIEQMALAGGGEPEFIYANQTTEEQAAAAVERFNRRTKTPVLTDISVAFNGVQPLDVLPEITAVQDLYDNRPLTFIGRYNDAASGSITIKGQSAQGRWEKTIPIDFPAKQPENSSLPTLWARAKIDALVGQDLLGVQQGQPNPDIRAKIITLGETFNVMSQFTSFVAVDKLRVTVEGKPLLVHIPIELPDQTNWEGFFGEQPALNKDDHGDRDRSRRRLMLKTDVIDKLVASNEVLLRQQEGQKNASDPKGLIEEEETKKEAESNLGAIRAQRQRDLSSAGRGGSATRGDSVGGGTPLPMAAPAPGATPASTAAPAIATTNSAKPSAPPAPASTAPREEAARVAGDSSVGFRPTANSTTGSHALNFRLNAVGASGQPTTNAFGTVAVPSIGLENVLSSNSGGGGGQSPFNSSYTYKDADRGRSLADVQSDSDGQSSKMYTFWWQRSTPSLSSHAASNTSVSPTDLRAYFGSLDDAGVSTLSPGGLTSFVALGREATSAGPVQLITLAATQLAESGQIDKAERLVCSTFNVQTGADAASSNSPSLPTDRLCEVLRKNLPDAERTAAIREVCDEVCTQLLDRRREEILVRKLAPDVVIHTPTAERYRALAPPAPQPTDQSAVEGKLDDIAKKETRAEKQTPALKPISLVVTILLANTSDKTIEALKALGLKIETVRPEASVVVARVPIDKIEDLALLEVVKRVELVPMTDETAR